MIMSRDIVVFFLKWNQCYDKVSYVFQNSMKFQLLDGYIGDVHLEFCWTCGFCHSRKQNEISYLDKINYMEILRFFFKDYKHTVNTIFILWSLYRPSPTCRSVPLKSCQYFDSRIISFQATIMMFVLALHSSCQEKVNVSDITSFR